MNIRVDVLFDSPDENARNDLWGLGSHVRRTAQRHGPVNRRGRPRASSSDTPRPRATLLSACVDVNPETSF